MQVFPRDVCDVFLTQYVDTWKQLRWMSQERFSLELSNKEVYS